MEVHRRVDMDTIVCHKRHLLSTVTKQKIKIIIWFRRSFQKGSAFFDVHKEASFV